MKGKGAVALLDQPQVVVVQFQLIANVLPYFLVAGLDQPQLLELGPLLSLLHPQTGLAPFLLHELLLLGGALPIDLDRLDGGVLAAVAYFYEVSPLAGGLVGLALFGLDLGEVVHLCDRGGSPGSVVFFEVSDRG